MTMTTGSLYKPDSAGPSLFITLKRTKSLRQCFGGFMVNRIANLRPAYDEFSY
jgi:hypothetical protein